MTDAHTTRIAPPTRSLHRSRNERIVAGVAGGLGEHLGVNAWWFRWALIFLSVFGGAGLLIYLIAWVVIPGPDEDDPIATGWVKRIDLSDGGAIFGIVLVGVAVILLTSRIVDISASLIVAAVLFVIGMLLYRGDLRFPGSPTSEPLHSTSMSSGNVVDRSIDDTAGGDDVPPVASIPAESQMPPKTPKERSILGRLTVAVALIVLSSVALIDAAFGDVDVEPVHYAATLMAIVGIGLLVGAWAGRARWLIVFGVLLLPILLVATFWPRAFPWTAGDPLFQPLSVAQVDSPYELGAGQLTIDLSGLTTQQLAQVGVIQGSLGVGEMIVRIPSDVGVDVDARIGAGSFRQPFGEMPGIGVDVRVMYGPPPMVVTLDLEVGAGVITIVQVSTFKGSS